MARLIFKDEVFALIGAAMEVHREKGCGFAGPVYQECMEIQLADQKIPAEAQKEMAIFYKGRRLKKTYLADFVVYGKIIVELKALDQLTSREESQVINHLKSSGLELGVLLNSGAASLERKRIVLTTRGSEAVNLQPKSKCSSRQFA